MCFVDFLDLHRYRHAMETAQVIKTEAEDNTHLEVITVSKNEKNYSDYIQYASSSASVLSLLSGFTFTAFTILLAQLPEPSSIISQFTLFFLAALFYVFIILLAWVHVVQMIRYCKNVPPPSRGLNTFNYLSVLSYIGLEFSIVLMLLIWNLVYLALATGIMWAISAILFISGTKPFLEYRKTIS